MPLKQYSSDSLETKNLCKAEIINELFSFVWGISRCGIIVYAIEEFPFKVFSGRVLNTISLLINFE